MSILRRVLSVLTLLVLPKILSGRDLSAQAYTPQLTERSQQQAATAKSAPLPSPPPQVLAAQLPAPPARNWPAYQAPNQATVSWDNKGLKIEASDSSLNQILHLVAAETGAELEGLTQDQRVFGSYGPGPAGDVLWKLLDGSGYNLLMIGSDDAAPLEIVLSVRSPARKQTAVSDRNRSKSEQLEPEPRPDYPPEAPFPPPIDNPYGNGEPPRDPLKFMEEILERQQQIDQQPQDQQHGPLHPPAPLFL